MEIFSLNDEVHQGFSSLKFFSSDDIIAGHYDGYVSLFNIKDSETNCYQRRLHQTAVINIDLNLHHGHLFTSDQLEILMSDLNKSKIVRQFLGHSECIFSLKINPFGNILISGGSDKTILVWDVRTAKPINAILAHSSEVSSLDFSFDSSFIVSAGIDGYCRMWDIYDGKCQNTFQLENSPPLAGLKLSANAEYLLLSALEDSLSLWSIKTGKTVVNYKGINSKIIRGMTSLGHVNKNILLPCFFADSTLMSTEDKHIVVMSENNKINIWNAAEPGIKHTHELPTEEKVKTWDLSEENQAAVLFGKNSCKVFNLKL